MPIRINLLAEDHAIEEERRRDPVKRICLASGLMVALVLAWSSVLQFKIISARSKLNSLQAQWTGMEKDYERAAEQQRKVMQAEKHITALQNLTTNRFLWGNALNALQKAMVGVENIQVVHLKCAQSYLTTEAGKSIKRNGMEIPGKPPQANEVISMQIQAIDTSRQPGGSVDRFKQAISKVPYFEERLKKTNGVMLTSLSAPQVAPAGREPFVTFSVQCYFPEIVR